MNLEGEALPEYREVDLPQKIAGGYLTVEFYTRVVENSWWELASKWAIVSEIKVSLNDDSRLPIKWLLWDIGWEKVLDLGDYFYPIGMDGEG